MIVKNGQIIAIGNVNTGGTLSGNGLSGSPLGLRDDAVKLTPASSGIDIKKIVAEDGKIEYQLGISADITVEGGKGIKSEKIDDKTYKVSVSADYLTSANNSLSGKDLVLRDNQWVELSAVPEAKEYSGGEGIKVKDHIISVSGDYITSADDKFAGKSLVLKDNIWVPADEASGDIITTNTFNNYSSFVNNNFVTNSSFSSYSSYIDNSIYNLTNIANSYSSYSSYYYNTYNAVSSYSSYWNNHSALSATKLDKADSGLFMQVAKLEGTPDNKLSGYGGSAFYTPEIPDIPVYSGKDGIKVDDYWICISADYLSANALDNLSGNWDSVYGTVNDASARWDAHSALSAEVEKKLDASESAKFMKVSGLEYNEDKISGYAGSAFYVPTVHDYKGGNGIEITNNYIINISADYLSASEHFLSANALDNLSGNWDSVYGTVEKYSANWNEASAFSANSGKFVTSGGMTFAENLAYVLAKQNNGVVWSGLDVSELGKKYVLTSTNETIYVGSAIDGNTITYNLSANIPEIPGISGENGLSGYFDTEANKYVVGVDERGLTYYKGNVGIDADDTLTNDILPFDTNGGQAENIIVENGVFTLPSNVAKVTFSINEVVVDNITYTDNNVNHDFNLNRIALYCDNSEVISTQEYYHNELGLSELSLTYTIDNSTQGSNVYSIRYEGMPLTGNGTLTCKLSIIEEVLSLSQGGGSTGIEYHDKANNLVHVDNTNHEIYMDDLSGVTPIYVDNKKNIGLNYDELQFDLSGGKLQINIQTSGGDIDQEAFEKLAKVINGRMTETIPFGALNNEATLTARQYSYLFRPTMEYEFTSATQAYMFCGGGDSHCSVAVYNITGNNNLIWQSNHTQVHQGEIIMDALNNTTGTISPDHLYYACLRIHKYGAQAGVGDMQNVLGLSMGHNITIDVGRPTPWIGLANIGSLDFPTTINFAGGAAGSMDGFGSHKPYIGFRTKDN